MSLMRAGGEMRLLLIATTGGHWGKMSCGQHSVETMKLTVWWLLTAISRLSRRHEKHGLVLARLRVLMHHHGGAATWARKPTMRLRGGCVLRIGVARRRRVHLHLRGIRGHSLGRPHIRAVGRLLYHHGGSHTSLRAHELGAALVRPHVACLWTSIEMHRLTIGQLGMRRHGRSISHGVLAHARRREHLGT